MSILQLHTLPELHERFCQESLLIRNLTKQTIRFYKNGFSTLLRFKNFKSLKELDEMELMNYVFWGTKECSWAPATRLSHYNSLNSFFVWCSKRDDSFTNPLKAIPKPKLPTPLPKALSKKEAMRVYELSHVLPIPNSSTKPKYQKALEVSILAMFLFTGIRRQELIDLRVEDVNLDEDLTTVREGKGMKDRVLPIPMELKRVLNRYLNERENIGLLSPYFFAGHKYRGKVAVRTITRFFSRLCAASGIHFSAHILRHTFATLMLHSKCDLFSLSKMMGHSNINTTAIYLRLTNTLKKEQMDNHPLNRL